MRVLAVCTLAGCDWQYVRTDEGWSLGPDQDCPEVDPAVADDEEVAGATLVDLADRLSFAELSPVPWPDHDAEVEVSLAVVPGTARRECHGGDRLLVMATGVASTTDGSIVGTLFTTDLAVKRTASGALDWNGLPTPLPADEVNGTLDLTTACAGYDEAEHHGPELRIGTFGHDAVLDKVFLDCLFYYWAGDVEGLVWAALR